MFKIENNEVYLTRGDTAILTIEIKDSNGVPYIRRDNDVIVFTLKPSVDMKKPTLQKFVNADRIILAPDDTKNLIIGDYVYDVQLVIPKGGVFPMTEKGFEPLECDYVDTIIPPCKFHLLEEVTDDVHNSRGLHGVLSVVGGVEDEQ